MTARELSGLVDDAINEQLAYAENFDHETKQSLVWPLGFRMRRDAGTEWSLLALVSQIDEGIRRKGLEGWMALLPDCHRTSTRFGGDEDVKREFRLVYRAARCTDIRDGEDMLAAALRRAKQYPVPIRTTECDDPAYCLFINVARQYQYMSGNRDISIPQKKWGELLAIQHRPQQAISEYIACAIADGYIVKRARHRFIPGGGHSRAAYYRYQDGGEN